MLLSTVRPLPRRRPLPGLPALAGQLPRLGRISRCLPLSHAIARRGCVVWARASARALPAAMIDGYLHHKALGSRACWCCSAAHPRRLQHAGASVPQGLWALWLGVCRNGASCPAEPRDGSQCARPASTMVSTVFSAAATSAACCHLRRSAAHTGST